MAITYSASTGAVITSYAMNETLGDQTQQSGNNTVVVSDDIVTAGNGQINTSYYGTYVGRKVLINIGATEQERVVTSQAAGTGTTIILTVHEDWDTNPAQNDTIHVFYTVPDIDSAGGIGYQTKTGIWECSNVVDIGNGTDPAGLHIGDYLAIEFDDQGTSPDLIVNSNGRFDIGRKDGGVPSSGGHVTFYDNGALERAVNMNGGTLQWYDAYIWSQLQPLEVRSISSGNIYRFESVKFLNLAYAFVISGNSIFKDVVITGTNNTNEDVNISSDSFGATQDNITFVQLHSISGAGSAGTRTLKNCSWTACTNDLIIINSDNWIIINPVWNVTSHTDINAAAVTGTAAVNDARSVEVEVQTAAGTALANANVIIYEGTQLDDLVLEAVTDSNGLVDDYFVYRLMSWTTGTGSTTTYGNHAFRVDKWLYTPIASAQVSTDPRIGSVTLLPDNEIAQTTQATALTAGSGTTVTEETNPATLIDFTGGSGTLAVGMVLTFTPSGATGTIVEQQDGDSVSGTFLLDTRNATAIANGDTFSRTGGTAGTFSGTYANNTQQPFTFVISAPTISYQALYDYLAALTAETTLSATGEVIHEWGRDQQGRILYNTGGTFTTERSNGKGVFIVGATTGTVGYFTDDSGNTWTPPTTVSVTVTVLDADTGSPIALTAHVLLIDDATKAIDILRSATNASGVATNSYSGTVPLDVVGWVRESNLSGTDYVQQDISGTVTAAGLSLTIRLNPI